MIVPDLYTQTGVGVTVAVGEDVGKGVSVDGTDVGELYGIVEDGVGLTAGVAESLK